MSDDRPDDPADEPLDDEEARPNGFDDDRPLTRTDMNLFSQSLRADWPMSPQTRNWMLREIGKLAVTCKSKRTRLIAFKTLMASSGLNIRQQTLDLARAKFEAEREQGDGPTAVDVVKEMQEAAKRYEREHPSDPPGDRGGTDAVQGGPEPVQ